MENNNIKNYFMNEVVTLIECQLENSTQWYQIENASLTLTKLILKNSKNEDVNGNSINVREFENAEFRFDDQFGKFQIENSGHILMKFSEQNTPKEILALLKF